MPDILRSVNLQAALLEALNIDYNIAFRGTLTHTHTHCSTPPPIDSTPVHQSIIHTPFVVTFRASHTCHSRSSRWFAGSVDDPEDMKKSREVLVETMRHLVQVYGALD